MTSFIKRIERDDIKELTAHDRHLERQRIAEEQHIKRVALARQEHMNVFELIEKNGLQLHGDIEYFAELVRADEREACARECLEVGDISTLTRKETRVTTLCIEAILARREK